MYIYQHICIVRLKKNTANESIEDLLFKKAKQLHLYTSTSLKGGIMQVFINFVLTESNISEFELKFHTLLHVMLVMLCILTKYIKMK